MRLAVYGLFVIHLLLWYTSLSAQELKKETIPDWVTVQAVDYTSTKQDKDAEDGFLDMVYEEQVLLQHQARYFKKAIKVITEEGVQSSSQISVSFDPAYQQLSFHTIRIIRGAKSIDKLQLSKIKTIQQETELNRYLYNGSKTALLVLEDVRKGDVIEYSYSVKGFNPIFRNKYAHFFDAQFSVPVSFIYYKLIVPAGRKVNVKNSLTNISPSLKSVQGNSVYEWSLREVPPLRVQDKLPSWYDPYPMIMVSEFQSWKEVADWALELFPLQPAPSSALQQKINELKLKYNTNEERIGAALRFVQDDVRYMGIEMGVNSHKPNAPDKVFAQRFGDCKDKSYLLCTMLRAMGIEAYPVLINTAYKKTIQSWLPSTVAFDHVTVTVQTEGKQYWFDPTIPYQRGSIEDIAFPDYQCGLVVRPGTTTLVPIPLQDKGKVEVKETININSLSGLAYLEVKTEYSGSFADDMRSELNKNSNYELQKTYQDYYATYFKKIKADSLTYKDNEHTGVLTVYEYYTIKGLWTDENKLKKAFFYPFVINSLLKKPYDEDRTMPFSLPFPARYTEVIEINLPEDWDAEDFEETFECSGFRLKSKGVYNLRQIVLTYEYESLKDHIAAEEADAYLAAYDKVDNSVGYSLSYDEKGFAADAGISSGYSENRFAYLYLILGLCVFITVLVRRNRRA